MLKDRLSYSLTFMWIIGQLPYLHTEMSPGGVEFSVWGRNVITFIFWYKIFLCVCCVSSGSTIQRRMWSQLSSSVLWKKLVISSTWLLICHWICYHVLKRRLQIASYRHTYVHIIKMLQLHIILTHFTLSNLISPYLIFPYLILCYLILTYLHSCTRQNQGQR